MMLNRWFVILNWVCLLGGRCAVGKWLWAAQSGTQKWKTKRAVCFG